MRSLTVNRLAVATVGVLVALAWMRPRLEAYPSPLGGMGGVAGGEEKEMPDPPRVYFKAPVTAGAAKIWTKLQQPVPMKFAAETTLDDFITAVKQATVDPKELPEGLPFYVDPVGLQEAEKTMQSTITINLDGIRLETALKLVLKQLDLQYHVHPDGFLIITYVKSGDAHTPDDVNALILDKLDRLEKTVSELRSELKLKR